MATEHVVEDGGADGEPVVARVVEEVASLRGAGPTDIDPIQDDVDGDALEQLVAGHPDVLIEFVTNGCLVTVGPNGRVTVQHADD